jgi:hypothetical protein
MPRGQVRHRFVGFFFGRDARRCSCIHLQVAVRRLLRVIDQERLAALLAAEVQLHVAISWARTASWRRLRASWQRAPPRQPAVVRAEITDPAQVAMLDEAASRGFLRVEPVTDLAALTLFAELIAHIDRGEAACLALAVTKGFMVASDEKRRFRRALSTA